MIDIAAIAFQRLQGFSYGSKKTLLEKFGSSQAILSVGTSKSATSEDEQRMLESIRKTINLRRAEEDRKLLDRIGAWAIEYGDPAYPYLLTQIPDPPLVLYGLGQRWNNEWITLGFVGPRRPSSYGARVARMLAEDLLREGVVLVSGLARGIDAIAHEISVKRHAPTVAVLACGIDRVYPPEHSLLRQQILKEGMVVTEFPPTEPPHWRHFPSRNRIISGLSRGVMIIEAGERSGALITTRHAADQSREVYAVPGPIDSPLSFGTNRLLSEGAKVVTSTLDVLEELFPNRKGSFSDRVDESKRPTVSSNARRIFRHFSGEDAIAVDELVHREGMTVSEVLQSMGELEMSGLVTRQPDARYVRI